MHTERLRGNETVTVDDAASEQHRGRVLEFWTYVFGTQTGPAGEVHPLPRAA
jgi:hypothetical protein